MTTRNSYLQQWEKYPERPQGWLLGRIVRLEAKRFWVSLPLDGSAKKLKLIEVPLRTEFQWVGLGDWVAFPRQKNRLMLLAPSHAEMPTPRAEIHVLKAWSELQIQLRTFFAKRNFLEITTPSLVSCPGTEVHIEPFRTEFRMGQKTQNYYLPTSPELHLKKALMLGCSQVFEIKTCFRNGEISPIHQPEFQMLEWYRIGETLESIQKDLQDLVMSLAKVIRPEKKAKKIVFKTKTVAALFNELLDFELRPNTSLIELQELAKRESLSGPDSDWNDLFHLIFLERIEAQLNPEHAIFVTDYPPSQAAYSRINSRGWADRFELYWRGMEIANAFHEINDPELQLERMQNDLLEKTKLGKSQVTLDLEFNNWMKAGAPPSSGIAVGVDRLFMALTGLKSLTEVRLFPM